MVTKKKSNKIKNQNYSTKSTFKKFRKKDIPKLNYGILHSQFGLPDGVSIVMRQIEEVLINHMNIPKKNIKYLVGKNKKSEKRIKQDSLFWDGNSINKIAIQNFENGLGGEKSEIIEKTINEAKLKIEKWIQKEKIEVIIAHNMSHPVNFIFAIALHRYYRDSIKKNIKTPKYLLWWHDSHLERKHFQKPSSDISEYLIEGIPGRFVEYILFINSTQFKNAEKYMLQLDSLKPGFYESISDNHDVIYNTTDTFIETYDDLEKDWSIRVEKFLEDFKVNNLLKENNIKLKETLFVLQHTRVIPRKRIDFALEYIFELFEKLKKNRRKKIKGIYFFVSGHTGLKSQSTRSKLIRLHKKLSKKYNTNKIFLRFYDKVNTKSDLNFEEIPHIFAKLGGITTYFSEVEGFGNNLLEVLASGLIPVVYTYPVFKEDIAKFKFKCISLEEFCVDEKSMKSTIEIINNNRKRKIWVNRNLKIIRKNFKHQVMTRKITRAIIRKRTHI